MTELVLVIEDEEELAAALEYNLKREGYRARVAHTGSRGLELAQHPPTPDLVLLDLMLPDVSGVEVCRVLRQERTTRDVPVIMQTARGDEVDRIVGLEVGADDYVVKPFSVRELMLRVRAVLRRGRVGSERSDVLSVGSLRIDPTSHRVWVDEEEVLLTALEFRLLNMFLSRKGRVQTRQQLLEDVWQMRGEVTTRTVDTHVKRLRSKLGTAGLYIETLRGVGYRLTGP